MAMLVARRRVGQGDSKDLDSMANRFVLGAGRTLLTDDRADGARNK